MRCYWIAGSCISFLLKLGEKNAENDAVEEERYEQLKLLGSMLTCCHVIGF